MAPWTAAASNTSRVLYRRERLRRLVLAGHPLPDHGEDLAGQEAAERPRIRPNGFQRAFPPERAHFRRCDGGVPGRPTEHADRNPASAIASAPSPDTMLDHRPRRTEAKRGGDSGSSRAGPGSIPTASSRHGGRGEEALPRGQGAGRGGPGGLRRRGAGRLRANGRRQVDLRQAAGRGGPRPTA